MFRLSAKILAIAFASFLAYLFVLWLGEWIPQSEAEKHYSEFESRCLQIPDSECIGELAVLRLPEHHRFGTFEGRNLRYLGHGDVVDDRLKAQDRDSEFTNRESYLMNGLLTADIDAFLALPVYENTYLYSPIPRWLRYDYPGFGEGIPYLAAAEKATLASRGGVSSTPAQQALMQRWREALELHPEKRSVWLIIAREYRELGRFEEARYALSRAMALPANSAGESIPIHEIWQLYGTEEALNAAMRIEDSLRRISVLISLTRRSLKAGREDEARLIFTCFEDEIELLKPYTSRELSKQLAHAAQLAHDLGDPAAAARWAEAHYVNTVRSEYTSSKPFLEAAGIFASIGATERTIAVTHEGLKREKPHSSRSEEPSWGWYYTPLAFLEAAGTFANIGAEDEAVAAAYESLERAPTPGKVMFGVMHSYKTTNWYNTITGGVAGVLCRLGRYDEAFVVVNGNEAAGYSASRGCASALKQASRSMTIETLSRSLSLFSPRVFEVRHAAALVEAGHYDDAAEFIGNALDAPPETREWATANRNLPYLRLAVAMRNKALVRKVAAQIIIDAGEEDGEDSWDALAKAAVFIKKWPDNNVAQ